MAQDEPLVAQGRQDGSLQGLHLRVPPAQALVVPAHGLGPRPDPRAEHVGLPNAEFCDPNCETCAATNEVELSYLSLIVLRVRE